jgi:hypothetical protein
MVGGRPFYLCSTVCLDKFDRDPEGYVLPAPAADPGAGRKENGDHPHHHGCC